MKHMKRYSSHVWAIASVIVFLAIRFFLHTSFVSHGFIDGGLISYDGFYHYSFVQELMRAGNGIFFHNPFGTFDQQPSLFSLNALFLMPFYPLFSKNLFIFDIAISSFWLYLSTYFLLRIVENLKLKWQEIALMLFGGGMSFIAIYFNITYGNQALNTAWWGLNNILNQITSVEIIYHAIFFIGMYALISKKRVTLIVVAAVLALLHPFTSITLGIAIAAWIAYPIFFEKKKNLKLYIPEIASIILLTACSSYLYAVFLPQHSLDAAFLNKIYLDANFVIQPLTYLIALSFPVALLLIGLATSYKSQYKFDRQKVFMFAAVALFCVMMSFSFIVTNKIPQPAHWSRAYPFMFLIIVASVFLRQSDKKWKQAINIFLYFCLIIGLLDNVIAINKINESLLIEHRAPSILTQDQARIISLLKKESSGTFLYLKDCNESLMSGDFEYAISALTSQKPPYGHFFFSPHVIEFRKITSICDTKVNFPKEYTNGVNYLAIDSSISDYSKRISQKKDVLYKGKELTLFKLHQ